MNWEITLLQNLQTIRNPGLTALMEAISFMAESLFLVIIIATLYWCVNKKKTIRLAWLVLFSGVANGVIKNIIRAPRPFQKGVVSPLRVETATSYAFPSGHTQSATSFWLGATKIFKSKLICIVALIIIALTGLSRIYLGVHWPMDVIGGIITGVLAIGIADLLYDENKGFTNWHVIGVGIVAILLLLFPVEENLASSVGALWGFVVGCYLEEHYIKFDVKGDWRLQLKKLLIGFITTIILYMVLGSLFGANPVMKLVKYALLLLWITAGAPWLFKKLLGNHSKY